MKRILLPIVLAAFIFPGISQGTSDLFYPYVVFPTGSWPEAVAIGDVNGDGRNDVVMTTSYDAAPDNDYRLFVFLQNTSGELDPPLRYLTSGTYTEPPSTVDIGDVNNDDRNDVVVGNSGKNIEVFLQNNSGGLDAPVAYLTVDSESIKIADLNNDGLLDVVGIGWGTNSVSVFLQNGSGTLNPPVTYAVTHGGYDEVDVGDVNHDWLSDVIVMSGDGYENPNIGVLLQQVNGTLGAPVYYDLGGDKLTRGVAVGDVNGDTRQDIVVTYGGNSPNSKIGVFSQNRLGTLKPAVSYASYDCPEPVVIADVNGDGRYDIVLAHGGWDALGIYRQRNDGTIRPEELYLLPYATHYGPQGLAVGDINGDDHNDVVIADYNHGLVVLYNSQGPAIPNIDVSPSQVNFGSVFLGNQTSEMVTIYNRGTGDLTISSITITGPDADQFSQTKNCSTIPPGSYCMITATFIPVSEGKKTATLAILSNDSDEPSVSVSFSGYAGLPLFYPYLTIPTGSWPEAVAIGDVNGDGRNDVVMTTSFYFDPDNDYHLFVFLQAASGELEPSMKYPAGNGDSVDIGDLNNDGKKDVVVSASDAIGVFYQNEAGGLDPMVTYPLDHASGSDSYKIRIGDFNDDGLLDVVSIDWGKNVEIFFQNQERTLDPPVTYTVSHEGNSDLDVGDINHDGLTDIVLMRGQGYGHSNIGVLLQQPGGSFGSPVYYDLGVDEFTRGVAVGDVNGDIRQDIVVTYGGNWPDSKIGVFSQNDSGTLNPAVSYASYDCPEPVVIADVNGDGRQDIVLAHGGWYALGIYRQQNDGTIRPEELYSLPYATLYNPHGLAVGDINSDDHNDVVIADYNHGLVVLYNSQGPAIPNIDVSPSQVNFGTVFLADKTSEMVIIYNRGTGDLTINSITITGLDADDFSRTNPCSTVLPGDFCVITATFSPASTGKKAAILTILSNDPDEPSVDVSLSGYAGVPQFYPYLTIPTGSWPEAVAIGDVNGDGRNDVVMTTSFYFDPGNDYRLFVFLQNTSGELDLPIKYQTSGTYSESPMSVSVGDVNNDGLVDVVVGNAGKNIEVFLQNDSGGLDVPIGYLTTDSVIIKIADLNNDGLLDVVGLGQDLSIFLQNASGTLDPAVTYTVQHGGWDDLDAGDVNHDGLTDIIVMSGQGLYPNIGILLQQPDGSFASPVYYDLGVDELTSGVALGDVNGDTWQDVVVTYGGNWPDSKIGVFFQNSSGTLEPAVSYDSYDIPEPVEIGDINGDGRQDIIVAHGGWYALGVYVQYADGTLTPEQLYPLSYASHYNHQGLAIGDINGDGLNDVVVADYNHGLVVLYHREDEPNIQISPEQLHFGAIPVGQSTQKTLTLSNTSIMNLTIGSLSFSGTDATHFTKQNDTCSDQTLPPVSSCSVDVVFSPKAKGNRIAALSIPSDDPDTPVVDVPIQVHWKLKVLTPNGGETIPSGSAYTVQWVAPSTARGFNISYSMDNGVTWKPIQRGFTGTSIDWMVPEPTGNKKKCLVKVTGLTLGGKVVGEDKSDSTFTIEVVDVISPKDGETLISGTQPTISWTTNGTRFPVKDAKLYYTKNGGTTWIPIGIDDTNSGNYNAWTVPHVGNAKSECKVKVVLRNEKGATVGSGVSDGLFTISPP